MTFKKAFSAVLAVLLVVCLLAGCSAKESSYAGLDDAGYANKNEAVAESAGSSLSSSDSESSAGTPVNQKLIRTWYLDAETEALDTLLSDIEARVAELEGYIEAREVYNGSAYNSSRYRRASLTIRIPADRLGSFVAGVGEVSNITSSREESEDVTLSYVATESRIKALETEQARLLELLAQAESMNDLLLIESRLTEVRTELEEVTSQLRLYDNLVSYGTIHLSLNEVRQYTVVEEPESVWARMGKGFAESLKNLGNGLTEFAIFMVSALPYLLLIGAVVVAAVVLIKVSSKKKKKNQPPQNPQ